MLAKFLTSECIALNVLCKDWKAAVKAGTDLLLRKGAVETQYLTAIIRHHEEIGPYMVIAPGIMLAHARPEDGAKRVALSLITLADPIAFGNETNDPVRLLITLATTDSEAHLSLLSGLMELLSDETDMRRIFAAREVSEITDILQRYQ